MTRYWRGIVARAWREVRSEAPWATPVRMLIWLSTPIAAVLAWFMFRSAGAAPPYAAGLTAVVAGLVVLVAIAWKLASIPPLLDKERLDKIAELDARLTEKTRKVSNPNNVSMEEVLGFAIYGRWNDLPDENQFSPIMEAITQLEQFLTNGLLRAWGREERNHGPYRLIQQRHWDDYGLEPLDILEGKYQSKHKDGIWTGDERYCLMFNSDEIERVEWVRDLTYEADPRDEIGKYVARDERGWQIAVQCPLCAANRVVLREGHAVYKCGARLSHQFGTWFVAIPCQARSNAGRPIRSERESEQN